jgi:DGQHR domain-containing protein
MWTPNNDDGYQRGLVPKRIGEVAWYLMQSDGVMPTAILLSIRREIKFNPEKSVLEIPDEEPLWMIDGQHRVAGLIRAIEQGAQELKDYPFPVVIVINPEKFDEMRTFFVVNSQAKSVPTDVAERILQQTLAKRGRLSMEEKEAKTLKKSEKAVFTAQAVEVVDYLRARCSVWKDMVAVPGETKPHRYAVKQHTLVASLVGGPFKNTTFARLDINSMGELLGRYWESLQEIWPEAFAEPGKYSVRKSAGVWSLNMLFADVFERCREARDYSKSKMTELLGHLGENSSFWSSDPKVGNPLTLGTSMKTIGLLHTYLQERLPKLTLAGL